MAGLTEQVVLDIQAALRSIGEIRTSLRSIGEPITVDVEIDSSGAEELTRDLQAAEQAAEGLSDGLAQASTQADGTEVAARALQKAFGLSETEARELAGSLGSANFEADMLDANVRRAAREMGLTEDEARALTVGLRQSATASQEVADGTVRAQNAASNLASEWQIVRRLILGTSGVFGVRKLVSEFNDAVTAASDLEQSVGGVQSIFKDTANEILRAGDAAASTVGLTKNAYNELASILGAQLGAFGFASDEVAAKTQELISLGADLAATFGGPVADAVGAVSSLLRGERNPIERYGVAMNETLLRAHALEAGITDTNRQLTLQESAMASLSLLYQQTASAQGQFAREADTTAGALERQRASFGNIQAEVGEALVPLFQVLLEMGPALAQLFEGLGQALTAVIPTISTMARGLGEPLTLGLLAAAAAVGVLRAAFIALALHPAIAAVTLLASAFVYAAGKASELKSESRDLLEAWDDLDGRARTARIGDLFSQSQIELLQRAGIQLKDLADGTLSFAEARRQLDALGGFKDVDVRELRNAEDVLLNLERAERGVAEAAAEAAEARREELETIRLLATASRFQREQADPSIQGRLRARAADKKAAAEAAEEAQRLADAWKVLEDTAENTGVSFAFIAGNLGLFNAETRRAAHEIGLTNVELFDLVNALAAASTTQFSLHSAVQEFDLLLSVTNKAGKEVPATMKQMLDDLSRQAAAFAELEAGTTILEALGLTNLAAEIRQGGLDAVPALRGFLADIDSAVEANALLSGGGKIGEESMAALTEAIRNAEPETLAAILGNIDQYTSAEVRAAIISAAYDNVNLYSEEAQRLLGQAFSDLNLVVPVTLVPRINQQAFDEWNQGGMGPGGPSQGGNIIQNFYTEPEPTTATERIRQAAGGTAVPVP